MKKLITLLLAMLLLTACQENRKYILDTQGYNYAIMTLPNGEIVEGDIEYWRDYEGEQLEVKVDGVVYLVSSVNCVLIHKEK